MVSGTDRDYKALVVRIAVGIGEIERDRDSLYKKSK